MASGRLKGCSSWGASTFIGFETGESRADVVVPGFDGFFWLFTTCDIEDTGKHVVCVGGH